MEAMSDIQYINEPVRKLYKRFFPAAVASLLTATVASFIDAVILSNYLGTLMLSSVSICMPIYMLLNALAMLIASGAATLYAFYLGKNEKGEANKFYTAAFIAITAVGALLTLFGLLFTGEIITMLGADAEIYQATYDYARVLMFFMIPLMLYSLMLFFVRFDNDPNRTLAATITCAITNLGLDILFVGPLKMGPSGAALATCLAYTLGLLVNCTHFLSKKNTLVLILRDIKAARFLRSIKTGAPLSLSQFGMSVATGVFNVVLMKYAGAETVAIYAIITQLSMTAMAFYEGVGQTAQPIFSANFGAERLDRIKQVFKTGLIYEVCATVFCALIYIIAAPLLAGCFAVTEGDLLEKTCSAIRVYALAIPVTGLNIFVMYYFQSKEKIAPSITISLLHSTVMMIIMLLLFAVLIGGEAVWFTWLAAEGITLIPTAIMMRKSQKEHA